MSIRVLVVDDQHLVRAGFRGLIESAPDLVVVGEAENGTAAVAAARSRRPDVVLMDIRMPGLDGIEATRLITGEPATAGVRVLILTTFDHDEYVYGALRAGAAGFLLKDSRAAELLDAIRVIAAGDALLAPGITRRLIAEFARRDTPPPTPARPATVLAPITEREREVLVLVGEGLSNHEIGRRLHISPGTAKAHVGHLLAKLDARDRVQLVILAHRAGLVPVD
ncbi:response regulator [Embleya sp. AB8]|uniref:response regulator n=1 Tax=Embleya sp. AB8 TaxID=3156304 RepID=UPI003C7281F1